MILFFMILKKKKNLIYSFLFQYNDCHLINKYQDFLVRHDNSKKINSHVDLKMLFEQGKKSIFHEKKAQKVDFLRLIFRFYTKNGPWNSLSPHFMITLWNQKSRNAGTSCIKIDSSLNYVSLLYI